MASIGLVCLLREQAKQLEQERDELAAQNEGMREAIELYFKQYPAGARRVEWKRNIIPVRLSDGLDGLLIEERI